MEIKEKCRFTSNKAIKGEELKQVVSLVYDVIEKIKMLEDTEHHINTDVITVRLTETTNKDLDNLEIIFKSISFLIDVEIPDEDKNYKLKDSAWYINANEEKYLNDTYYYTQKIISILDNE